MLNVTPELIVKAKKLASENYESWGQYIVECYTDEELEECLEDFHSLEEWAEVRLTIANIHKEREAFYD